eukprot:TRINITY_DN101130_c0_g1_i1.p1 TRINITY_DN101130_c0_g1~~TRINITY_DN101130_c0_g1_i1.p1  ORF type:complete len:342 (-),score=65.89 TRINITY_DN101130_c0_g1_i1:56-1081(-)
MRRRIAVVAVLLAPCLVLAERPAGKERLKAVSGVRAEAAARARADHAEATPAPATPAPAAAAAATTTTTTTLAVPIPRIAAEIDRAKGKEQEIMDRLQNISSTLEGYLAANLTTAHVANTARLTEYTTIATQNTLTLQLAIDSFMGPVSARFNALKGTADNAEYDRNMLQSRTFGAVNGLSRTNCPAPAFDAQVAKTPMAKVGGSSLLLNGKAFSSFTKAWVMCIETRGCGQIVTQKANVSGVEQTHYALRRRSDAEVAQGADGVQGANLECALACPAECQALETGEYCGDCASASRECTACLPLAQDPDRNGCSGNCPPLFLDCRACPLPAATTPTPAPA